MMFFEAPHVVRGLALRPRRRVYPAIVMAGLTGVPAERVFRFAYCVVRIESESRIPHDALRPLTETVI